MQEGSGHETTLMGGFVSYSLPPSSCFSTFFLSKRDADVDGATYRRIPIEHDRGRWMYWTGERSEYSGPFSPGHAKSSRPYQRRRR
jgi:hypothetical protein